jgi:NitT/TauT family transport system substrate-binding protein
MAEDTGGLTPLGKVVVAVVVVGLIGLGVFLLRGTLFPPEAEGPGKQEIDLGKAQEQLGRTPTADQGTPEGVKVEAPDLAGITTVQEYKYVPREKLPPVKGVSAYQWDTTAKVVEFPINMWIGWLPIVAANRGFKPNEESVFFKKFGFKVNLTLIDDPVAARDAFAAGKSHVLWGTLDMMALFAPELMKDSRTAPRIYQQIDWSNGGDGIVVRGDIKSVKDLVGKTIVYAQNSPSQYYVNALLISAGIQPGAVKHKYTSSAFEAAAAFVADTSIDACASWAPDIYNIPEKVSGTRILSTTADASKLIADVWAVRADFARDHGDIVKGLVVGIFEGMEEVKKNPDQAAVWMAEGYGMPVEEVKGMMQDAHITNFAENKQFFLNANNPTNFERTWKAISFVYRELGLIGSPVRFDEVMDFSIIQAIEKEGLFAQQKDEYTAKFVPQDYTRVTAEEPILTQTLRVNFFPNSANLDEKARDSYGNVLADQLYDATIPAKMEVAGSLAGQFDAAVIAVTGHTDASMKGKVPYDAVKKLSLERAEAVKQALIAKFGFDPNKFVVEGKAWDLPSNPDDPNNHALNRRVEISVYQPERQ